MRAARVGDLASIFKKDAEARNKPYKEVKHKDSKHDKAAKKSKKKVKRPKFKNAFGDEEGASEDELDMNADPKRGHLHRKHKRQDVVDIHSEA